MFLFIITAVSSRNFISGTSWYLSPVASRVSHSTQSVSRSHLSELNIMGDEPVTKKVLLISKISLSVNSD